MEKITYPEALKALKNMANNKSPGSDGFTVEFYKFFWGDIGQLFVRAVNYGYEMGELSSTQKEGIITCIPKGDKPKEFLKNWRSISLLNVSYKIASACIANRLKSVLPNIINHDQTGFLSGRYIGENIRTLYDLMAYTETNNIPGLLLLIDFEKAFDSVAWSFIHKTLEFFNFGDSIKKWISVFYNNSKSCVIVNGHISSWFKLGRGCRQGDPLSPYIFILCVEILAHLIRRNTDIKGIKVDEREYLISQYADDTSLMLEATEKSLKTTLNIITYYAKFSGLSMNNEKTRVIWIGSLKNNPLKLCENLHLNWDQGHFTVLGVRFSTNLEEMIELNFNCKVREIKNLLIQWAKRNLTPFGKITVIKTLAMSKINHLLLALPSPPQHTLKTLQSLFYNFLWNNSRDKVKRKITIKDFTDGGLRMIDILSFDKALKLTWIRRLQNAEEQKWVNLLRAQWADYNNFLIFGNEYIQMNINKLNHFWKDVFGALDSFNSCITEQTLDNFLNEPVWYNSDIRVNNRCIFNRRMFESGVRIINDLIDENGKFISFEQYIANTSVNINFLEYNSLLMAIRQLKTKKYSDLAAFDSNIQTPTVPNMIKDIIKVQNGCRHIYQKYIKNNEIPTSVGKWIAEFGHIHSYRWYKIYQLLYKTTISTSARWFQFRLLHRILATNTFLHKIGIVTSNLCSFCKRDPETISHLFYQCPIISNFWMNVSQWLKDKCEHIDSLDFRKDEIIFGITNKNKADLTLNFIILSGKEYIYKCRTKQNIPLIQNFKSWLGISYNTEKYIAFKNCNWDKFNKKWSLYQGLFAIH